RIKKIMQTDEEIGKVAAAVPVIICIRSSHLKASSVFHCKFTLTAFKNIKQCIELEQQFDFLKDLVAAVPDMQGEGEDNHAEGGEKVARRGRKPGSGRKNGGVGCKGKDKKLSGTESEQEDDSEDSETDEDEEDGSQSSTNLQPQSRFHSPDTMPPQYLHMGTAQGGLAMPLGSFAPHPSLMGTAPPPPPSMPHKDEDDDDEDYDS
uniref:DR1-associated protein 1 (negative cofactor 2 alpha) n=1 Tax=Salmo trutta TaxID=8032 RepID=A0A674EAW2_SALTR